MRTFKLLNTAMIITGLAMFSMACSDNVSKNQNEVTIRGSVAGDQAAQSVHSKDPSAENSHEISSFQVSGATVYAARVTSSGSLQKIADSETVTDASGRFTLAIDMAPAQRVVIVAQNQGQELRGFVSNGVENGMSHTMKPINFESTAETSVFIELVRSGKAQLVTKTDIEMSIDAAVASSIQSNATLAVQYASALASAAEARAHYISTQSGSQANTVLNALMQKHVSAQLELESRLYSATSVSQRDAAMEAFAEATVNAYAEAGLSATQVASVVDMWGRIAIHRVSTTSSEFRNRVEKNLSVYTSIALDKAARVEAQAAGLSSATINAIAQAGVKLRSTVATTARTQAEIRAAFDTWKQEVKDAIESDGSAQASVIIQVNAEINSNSGAATIFRSAVNASVSAQVVSGAYTTFIGSVRDVAKSRLSGASEMQAQATSNLIILLNLK